MAELVTIVLAPLGRRRTGLARGCCPSRPPGALADAPSWHDVLVVAAAVLVVVLSYWPVRNLLSPRQLMNASFDPLHLVNTYGAFGSITRVRYEVVVEGTDDADADADDASGGSTSSRASRATRGAGPASSRRTTCASTG